MALRASAQSRKKDKIYYIYIQAFFIVPSLLSPFTFWIFFIYFVYGFWYFSALLSFPNPVKFVPLLRLNTGGDVKPDGEGGAVGGGVAAGVECLDSDGLMASDGRCLSLLSVL